MSVMMSTGVAAGSIDLTKEISGRFLHSMQCNIKHLLKSTKEHHYRNLIPTSLRDFYNMTYESGQKT